MPAGKVEDEPVINTDWLPTLLELSGQAAPTGFDGVSIATLLNGRGPAPHRAFFWHFPHYTNQGSRPCGAMRDGNWMLVELYDSDVAELYDLNEDPEERRDLSAKHPDRVAQMGAALAAWRRGINAQENKPNPGFSPNAFRELYQDVDASRFLPETADQTQWESMWRWRRGMNAAPSLKPQ